ncbi:MAG: Holliday junction branch migration protein RuvA, partial [Tetragenococcus halophilus]|nr:Holliday junction branch migration protein RuvA [Tetragenococcus halophilus]
HTLYGFNTLEEKNLFLRLISVSGIGPKSGLAIMANEDHEGLIAAIESSNINFLTKFPGVGKKTAQQLILDLQGKLGEAPATNQNTDQSSLENSALEEAMEALQALGYTEKEVKKSYKSLKEEEAMTTDEYLRKALKIMMKK